MPSEATHAGTEAPVEGATPLDRALESVAGRIRAFQAAVAAAEREVAAEIQRRVGQESFKGEQAIIELGPFAVGRIDPDRFAQLLGVADTPLTAEAIDVLGRADDILKEFDVSAADHVVEVEAGGDLRDAVKDALARFGRAYGAARAVELARAGIFDETEHAHLLGPLPFRLWNRAERQLAPPLVIRVRGEDCLPAGLGEFLDGNLVLLLVVEGPTTPSPLSRLITPGTFVMQTADPEELERLGETEHPAVALLFDEERPGQACFVHDPDAGSTPWARLDVRQMPSEADVGRGRRPPTWLEELDHLRTMATAPAGGAAGATSAASAKAAGGASGAAAASEAGAAAASDATAEGGGSGQAATADPVDRLAAWLLDRADLDGAEEGAPPPEGS